MCGKVEEMAKTAYLVSRMIKFFDGTEVAVPLRTVDDEENAKRLVEEYDRDLRVKMSSSMVVQREDLVGTNEQSVKGPATVVPVGSLVAVMRAELQVELVAHAVFTIPSGQPSRVVPAPNVRLS